MAVMTEMQISPHLRRPCFTPGGSVGLNAGRVAADAFMSRSPIQILCISVFDFLLLEAFVVSGGADTILLSAEASAFGNLVQSIDVLLFPQMLC